MALSQCTILSNLQAHSLLLVHIHPWLHTEELLHAQVPVRTCSFQSSQKAPIQANIKLKHHIIQGALCPRLPQVEMTTLSFMLLLYPVHSCIFIILHASFLTLYPMQAGSTAYWSLNFLCIVPGTQQLFIKRSMNEKDEIVARMRKWSLIRLLEFYDY